MIKRTKSYILLLMLVLTGFGGSLYTNTLTSKERRALVGELKDTRSDFLKSIKGLSDAQLDFKPAPDKWSIRQCIQHIALAEGQLRRLTDATLQLPANPEKRAEIKLSDEAVLRLLADRSNKAQHTEAFDPAQAKWASLEETVDAFRESRADLIKYVKYATADMRNHVADMPFGALDAYQLLLVIAGHSARHTAQINEIKAHSGFPK